MMVHKKYKSILFLGMLFFCSISANEFPTILYSIYAEEFSVEDFGDEIVKGGDLSIPRFSKVVKVCLKHCYSARTYERTGYIFQNPAWTNQDSVGYYRCLSSEDEPIFEDGNIFYFQELKWKVSWHKPANSTGTDYKNESDMDISDYDSSDSCPTTQEFHYEDSEDESK